MDEKGKVTRVDGDAQAFWWTSGEGAYYRMWVRFLCVMPCSSHRNLPTHRHGLE